MQYKAELNYLEHVLMLWQNQFDEKPSMENLSVQISNYGMVHIGGHEICTRDILSISEYDIHPEYFNLLLVNGDYITVEILWTFDEPPVVSSICLHHFLY